MPRSVVWARVRGAGLVALVFAALALAVNVANTLAIQRFGVRILGNRATTYASNPTVDGWLRWDAGWYLHIAERGYFFQPTGASQSAVAFFPGYPGLLRILATLLDPTPLDGWLVGPEHPQPVTNESALAGITITLLAGLAAVVLLHAWSSRFVSQRESAIAAGVLLTYPFAFFLFGAVYSDALFLAATLAAFVLIERDHTLLAGLAGAAAAVTRPVGFAVVAALLLHALLRRRRDGAHGLGLIAPRGEVVALAGVVLYPLYLWARFDNPFAFLVAQRAWQVGGRDALLKSSARDILSGPIDFNFAMVITHAVVALVMLGTVPAVARRFGAAYGAYTAVVIIVPVLQSPNFIGVGRYCLAAFPAFLVLATWVGRYRAVSYVWFAVTTPALLFLSASFARSHYIS